MTIYLSDESIVVMEIVWCFFDTKMWADWSASHVYKRDIVQCALEIEITAPDDATCNHPFLCGNEVTRWLKSADWLSVPRAPEDYNHKPVIHTRQVAQCTTLAIQTTWWHYPNVEYMFHSSDHEWKTHTDMTTTLTIAHTPGFHTEVGAPWDCIYLIVGESSLQLIEVLQLQYTLVFQDWCH